MRLYLEIVIDKKVKDCTDCPCRKSHSGHGEGWYYCDHPKAPKSYGGILYGLYSDFEKLPKWCPIKDTRCPIKDTNS